MAKIILTADTHFRATVPINRKDDYVATQFRKFKHMLGLGLPIFIAGDFFDKATVPFWLFNRVCEELVGYDQKIYIIPGNHDLIGHNINKLDQGSLWTLDILPNVGVITHPDSVMYGSTLIHCCPFGEAPTRPDPAMKNILLVHEPVYEAVPFFMEGKASTVEGIKEKYPGYDLIVAGDIHIPVNRDGVLVPGSMLRSTIAQRGFRPCFYELDTDTTVLTTHEFPIEEDVWKDFNDVVQDDSYRAELKELKEAMEARDERLNYPKTCDHLAEGQPIAAEKIKTLIHEYEETK